MSAVAATAQRIVDVFVHARRQQRGVALLLQLFQLALVQILRFGQAAAELVRRLGHLDAELLQALELIGGGVREYCCVVFCEHERKEID